MFRSDAILKYLYIFKPRWVRWMDAELRAARAGCTELLKQVIPEM